MYVTLSCPLRCQLMVESYFFFQIFDGFDYMHDDRHHASFLCFYVMMHLGSCDEK